MSVTENIKNVRQRLERVCTQAGRNPSEIELIAVSKTVGVAQIAEASACGIKVVGENRVQEAWQKFQTTKVDVKWHMVGHLQSNKVRRVLQFCEMIQSVDSLSLAEEINRQACKLDRRMAVLIQVNCSGEASKFGFAPSEAIDAVERISELDHVTVEGLMTIGAYSKQTSEVRASFRKLRDLREKIEEKAFPGVRMRELSMGMTNDFEIAVEEGSTMLRIGRSIFGERLN